MLLNTIVGMVLAAAPLEATEPPLELILDAPLGLLSRSAASRARAELFAAAGPRIEVAWGPAPLTLAATLEAIATLPDRRGTQVVSFSEQQTLAALGARAGYRLRSRGFLLEPFAGLRAAGGWRWTSMRVEDQESSSGRPGLGLGYGGGAIAGYRALRLRLDLGGLWTGWAHYYTATLALGYAIP